MKFILESNSTRILIFFFLFLDLTSFLSSDFEDNCVLPNSFLIYNQPSLLSNQIVEETDINNYITLDDCFTGFKESLAFKESRGQYGVTNSFGYLGKYQFGISTLELLGVTDTSHFLLCAELQEKAFRANIERNKWKLSYEINYFSGKIINGIVLSESGILAAAHLAGPGGVKRYLNSKGNLELSDAFGTGISSYLKKFANYDLSSVIGEKNSKVQIH